MSRVEGNGFFPQFFFLINNEKLNQILLKQLNIIKEKNNFLRYGLQVAIYRSFYTWTSPQKIASGEG